MAVYLYKAIDASGALHTGELAVSTRSAALDVLHQRGLVPLDVSNSDAPTTAATWLSRAVQSPLAIFRSKPVTESDLLAVTHSLAALLKAGLTVDRALAI